MFAACGGGGGGSSSLPPSSSTLTSPATAAPAAGTSSAVLPITGAMPAWTSTSFGGTTASAASAATIVGLSTHLLTPDPNMAATTATDTFVIAEGTSMTSARRRHSAASAAAASAGAGSLRPEVGDADVATERIVRELRLMRSSSSAGRSGAARAAGAAESTRRVRDSASSQTFWVRDASINAASGTYIQVTASLVATSTHGDIYAMNSLVSDGLTANGSIASAIAADFDNAYVSDTTHFASDVYPASAVAAYGTAPYCSNDGSSAGTSGPAYVASARPAVLVLDPSAIGSGVGGFYNSLDLFAEGNVQCSASARAAGAHSNERPMIYVAWEGDFSASNVAFETQEDMVRKTAHEFQHLINFVQHDIIGDTHEETYINEGLSMLAQDLALAQMFPALHNDVLDSARHASIYLQAPQQYSLVGFSGIDATAYGGDGVTPKYNCSGCYGAAYLFQRYLYDRLGSDAYTHAEEIGGSTGLDHIAALAGRTDAGILSDFSLALAANGAGSSAAYAMPGFPFGQTLTAQLPNYATIVPNTGTVNGTSATALDGAFAFFSVPAGGSAVTLSASGAAPFAAGIDQH